MKMPVLYSFLSSMSGEWGRVNGRAEKQAGASVEQLSPRMLPDGDGAFFPSIMEKLFPFLSLSMSPSSVKIPCWICCVVFSTASMKV